MIPSHIFQFQHPIIVRKAPKNKYKFRQIAVIFQVGFVSFSVCSPDFSPHHVGADDSVGPICAPVLFFLLIEKEKNRRGVRRSQLHSVSAGAAKTPYPQPSSSFPNCDRFTGSQFGHLEFYNAARYLDDGGQATSCGYATSCRGGRLCPPVPNCDPAQRSQFGKEEGASGYGAFAAPAEAECSWLLLTPRCAARRDLSGGRV